MEGITNAAIRALLASYGPIGLVCTEFVRVAGDSVSKRHLAQQVQKAPGVALSVQIMGNDAALMALSINSPHRMWELATMTIIGSIIGCCLLYSVGRRGGGGL